MPSSRDKKRLETRSLLTAGETLNITNHRGATISRESFGGDAVIDLPHDLGKDGPRNRQRLGKRVHAIPSPLWLG